MSNQAIDVEILGKITRVNCPEGQEQPLLQAARELDSRLSEMASRTKITNEVTLLTITALNVCYELQIKQNESVGQQNQVNERIEKLVASLHEVLDALKEK